MADIDPVKIGRLWRHGGSMAEREEARTRMRELARDHALTAERRLRERAGYTPAAIHAQLAIYWQQEAQR